MQALSQFDQTRDQPHLTRARNQLNDLLEAASGLPPAPFGQAQDLIKEVIGPIREEIQELRTQMRNQLREFKEESEQLSTELKTLDARIEAAMAQLQQRTLTSDQEVANQVLRLDQAISNIQDRYTAGEENRSSEFRDAQIQRDQAWQDRSEDQRSQGQALVDRLEQYQTQAANVLGVSAASVTADAYLNQAKHQRRQADIWRGISVATFLVAAVVGIIILFLLAPQDASAARWGVFYASRLAVLTVIVTVAAVALRESGQHRSSERENMRLASQLTTFRPFLAELTESERNRLISDASLRYFPGHPGYNEGPRGRDSSQTEVSPGTDEEPSTH